MVVVGQRLANGSLNDSEWQCLCETCGDTLHPVVNASGQFPLHRFHQYRGHKHVNHVGRMVCLTQGHQAFSTTIGVFHRWRQLEGQVFFLSSFASLAMDYRSGVTFLKRWCLLPSFELGLQGFTTRSFMFQDHCCWKPYHSGVLWSIQRRLWKCIWHQEYFCQESTVICSCMGLSKSWAPTESLVDVDRWSRELIHCGLWRQYHGLAPLESFPFLEALSISS